MTAVVFEWQPHRLFPYERRLAAREVAALLEADPTERAGRLRVRMNGHSPDLFRRFTYFSHAMLPDGERVETDQSRLEALGRVRRVQTTRYSAHGLHEYKGKFNPQVVRAIGNILKLERGSTVLDPFSGSGTTLLECAHAGWNGVGLDLNPLAVFIANAKLAALHASPRTLERAANSLLVDLSKIGGLSFDRAWNAKQITSLLGSGWEKRMPNSDYLFRWFTPSVLAQFLILQDAITRIVPRHLRSVFLVIVSDLTRDASLQDPADLRIRRRKDPRANYPVLEWFDAAVRKRVASVVAARSVLGVLSSHQIAVEGDSRAPLTNLLQGRAKSDRPFDAAITSPPYATALPYIDTQRLSLCLLGLIDAREIGTRDRTLIGSRDVTRTERLRLEEELSTADGLPDEVVVLCRRLSRCAADGSSGFRRRNVPALTYRYFKDMAVTFRNVSESLSPGAPFALVVGQNRTTLGGEEISIDTPRLLAKIAVTRGFTLQELVELDTYQRFDLHQQNSIRSEWLLMLRREG